MNIKYYTLFAAFTIGLFSCAEEAKTTDVKEQIEVVSDTISEEKVIVDGEETMIDSKYSYDTDWEAIKKTIIEKDIAELDAWINGATVDSEVLIEACQENYVLNALKKATYKDLKTQEMDGEIYLVFYASVTEINEEGAEVGSSISIYLSQGDPDLRVEYMLAAG